MTERHTTEDEAEVASVAKKPTIVCICGSVRFWQEMNRVARDETLMGRIVVRPEVNMRDDPDYERMGTPAALAIKELLDELHFRKIDLADEVLFANVANYWGESTTREYHYAVAHGKTIRLFAPGLPPPRQQTLDDLTGRGP